ncbi:MAG: sel1 repeat family protein [Bacilli bacterium]|nr:sel1 repeat family protein [Bacilli bacterium]
MNTYIKLNNNDNHLSLGNLFNIIKKISKNKSSAIQTELFCIIFNIDNISETTVNNYCTGLRSINSTYKQIYINYKKKYQNNKNILIPTINNLLSIIDGYIYDIVEISELNDIESLKNLVTNLHPLVKNDIYVPKKLKKEILETIKSNNYYHSISLILFFIILDKKQPLYVEEEIKETIESISRNTNISINDLKKFLEIKFKEGISLIPSLKKLAKENNPYALHELGNLEYNGIIAGYPRYEEAFNYHKIAASFEHPTSNWMLAHMIINKKIGSLSEEDINNAWNYLQKAKSLDSISSLNTIGICYLHGYTPSKEINVKKAIDYFQLAIKNNYVYAYNNLGKIYEDKKDYKKAFEYYLLSANQEESWACNKVAEYYRLGIYVEKDIEKAYKYYTIGANAPISNRCNWNTYNLVKYFYLEGNSTLGIKKDIDKSISLLKEIKDFEYTNELLLYAYYELYLLNNNYLTEVNYYLNELNTSIILNKEYKNKIENKLKEIETNIIKIDYN